MKSWPSIGIKISVAKRGKRISKIEKMGKQGTECAPLLAKVYERVRPFFIPKPI